MGTTRSAVILTLPVLVACGGSTVAPVQSPAPSEKVAVASVATAAQPVAEPSEPGVQIPMTCAEGSKDSCLPDAAFVTRMCEQRKPGVALAMFAKGTPWARAYIRARSIAAWVVGAATEEIHLEFDEEVIIIRHRAPAAGGMVVSGAGDGYDVIRWDGSCVALDANEITRYLPPSPKNPELPWKQYDDRVQEALLQDNAVAAAYKVRRNECKGITMGEVSEACAKANHALSRAVARYVRAGGSVPLPERLR